MAVRSIGVFGGTFDPPHVAHLILASEAYYQLSLERVLWVLTPVPPHKPDPVTALDIRHEMVLAAIHNNNAFEFSSVDIDRGPPHYAVDTILLLQRRYPKARLTYLMGADSLRDLPAWHQPDLFVQRCDCIGVMSRPDVEVDLSSLYALFPELIHKVRFINTPALEFSSTEIRRRVANGWSYRYYLTDEVYNLVLKYHLYQMR